LGKTKFDLSLHFAENIPFGIKASQPEAAVKVVALHLSKHDSPLVGDGAPTARDQVDAPTGESRLYSFSL
jgi:hypothetical protein